MDVRSVVAARFGWNFSTWIFASGSAFAHTWLKMLDGLIDSLRSASFRCAHAVGGVQSHPALWVHRETRAQATKPNKARRPLPLRTKAVALASSERGETDFHILNIEKLQTVLP